MWQYTYANELYHYGVKGMKWGVRRTPEQLGHRKKASADNRTEIAKISGHSPTPKKSKANSIMDHVSESGKTDVRTFYGPDGMKEKDIHTTSHGNPKTHNFGKNGEHVVLYEWHDDGHVKNKIRRELTDQERKENEDIL